MFQHNSAPTPDQQTTLRKLTAGGTALIAAAALMGAPESTKNTAPGLPMQTAEAPLVEDRGFDRVTPAPKINSKENQAPDLSYTDAGSSELPSAPAVAEDYNPAQSADAPTETAEKEDVVAETKGEAVSTNPAEEPVQEESIDEKEVHRDYALYNDAPLNEETTENEHEYTDQPAQNEPERVVDPNSVEAAFNRLKENFFKPEFPRQMANAFVEFPEKGGEKYLVSDPAVHYDKQANVILFAYYHRDAPGKLAIQAYAPEAADMLNIYKDEFSGDPSLVEVGGPLTMPEGENWVGGGFETQNNVTFGRYMEGPEPEIDKSISHKFVVEGDSIKIAPRTNEVVTEQPVR